MTENIANPLRIPFQELNLEALYLQARQPRALYVYAHGAGAGMQHWFMEQTATVLCSCGISTLRFNFPYMQAGKRRSDAPRLIMNCIAAATGFAANLEPQLPLLLGGKSMGGRLSTMLAADPPSKLPSTLAGVVLMGYPLHAAGKPSTKRAEHLPRVPYPMLFLQGTRDKLADVELVNQAIVPLPLSTVHYIEGADHGFAVLKRSGRNFEDVLTEIKSAVETWLGERGQLSIGKGLAT